MIDAQKIVKPLAGYVEIFPPFKTKGKHFYVINKRPTVREFLVVLSEQASLPLVDLHDLFGALSRRRILQIMKIASFRPHGCRQRMKE